MAFVRTLFKRIVPNYKTYQRCFTLYPGLQLKQITEKQEGSTLVIQGEYVNSPRESFLLNTKVQQRCCPVCSTGLNIKHTDVLILSQFVRSDGCMLPRRITGLCKRQQKRISAMVTMAQKSGLMSNLTPATSKKDPKLRKKWKKFNIYFDESTLKW